MRASVHARRHPLLWLALLCVVSAAAGLWFGSAEQPTREIVLGIRLPRVVLGALVGAGLATAGALLQALQNPLGDDLVDAFCQVISSEPLRS